MRIALGLISLIAVAMVTASATLVLTKEDTPRLAVTVEGVPGYVYYNRPYDLTIEYANNGGDIDGLLELSVQLPETFALADRIDDPTRHGERLVWQLDGLRTGETGSVQISVQGTLPDDLTNAVYDLPGYEGHTAFVEGFELAASLTGETASAETFAVADTGAQLPTLVTITKVCVPADDPGSFIFTITDLQAVEQEFNPIDCDDVGFGVPLAPNTYTLEETGDVGTDISDYDVSFSGGCADNGDGTATFTVPPGPPVPFSCVVTNTLNAGILNVEKVCVPADDPGMFNIEVVIAGIVVADDALACGESLSFPVATPATYTVTEEAATGYDVEYGGDCDAEGTGTVTGNEEVTCTITNTRLTGNIVIRKELGPDPVGTGFGFTDDIPDCTVGPLDDDDDAQNPTGTPSSTSCLNVPAGTYFVTEDDPSGLDYFLSDISCAEMEEAPTQTTVDVAARTATIGLDPGETVQCMFTNEPEDPGNASITIVKDTNPETDDTAFEFDTNFSADFFLEDDDSETVDSLDAGTYTVTESEPPDWDLVDIDCGNADVNVNLGAESVTIDLDAGEDVTCVFTNQGPDDDPTPTRTPTRTPTPVTTPVPGTPVPSPPAPVATPAAQAGGGTAGVQRLPSTGSGGDDNSGSGIWLGLGLVALGTLTSFAGFYARRAR